MLSACSICNAGGLGAWYVWAGGSPNPVYSGWAYLSRRSYLLWFWLGRSLLLPPALGLLLLWIQGCCCTALRIPLLDFGTRLPESFPDLLNGHLSLAYRDTSTRGIGFP